MLLHYTLLAALWTGMSFQKAVKATDTSQGTAVHLVTLRPVLSTRFVTLLLDQRPAYVLIYSVVCAHFCPVFDLTTPSRGQLRSRISPCLSGVGILKFRRRWCQIWPLDTILRHLRLFVSHRRNIFVLSSLSQPSACFSRHFATKILCAFLVFPFQLYIQCSVTNVLVPYDHINHVVRQTVTYYVACPLRPS